jgi:hypothetical protein
MKLQVLGQGQNIKYYRKIFLKSLFFIFLLLVKKAFCLQQENDWSGNFSLGAGYARYQKEEKNYLFHSRLGLFIKPINSLPFFESKISLMTQSSLKEESGFISVPLKDLKFLDISEIWIKNKFSEKFELQVGSFPDMPSEAIPKTWPFYSVGLKIDVVKNRFLDLNISLRHDDLWIFSYENNSSQATKIKRDRFESHLHGFLENLKNKFFFDFKFHFSKYDDPEQALTSLSIGRHDDIENNVTKKDQKYSIFDMEQSFFYVYNNFIKTGFYIKYWNNLLARNYNDGSLFGFSNDFLFKTLSFGSSHWFFGGQQNFLPPCALSSNYYPGFQIFSNRFYFLKNFKNKIKSSLEYQYQNVFVFGQDSDPNVHPGEKALVPLSRFYFTIEFIFNDL